MLSILYQKNHSQTQNICGRTSEPHIFFLLNFSVINVLKTELGNICSKWAKIIYHLFTYINKYIYIYINKYIYYFWELYVISINLYEMEYVCQIYICPCRNTAERNIWI